MGRINLTLRPSLIHLVLLLSSHGLAMLVVIQSLLPVAEGPVLGVIASFIVATLLMSLISTLLDWSGLSKDTVVRYEASSENWLLWFADGSFKEAQLAGDVLVWRYLVIVRLSVSESNHWFVAYRDSLSSSSHRRIRAFLNIYGLHGISSADS